MKRTKTIFFTALAILCTSFTASATVITLDFNAAEACGKKKMARLKLA
jgi:hypothetical protein